ncbi:MAG: NYN domain-containing protein [Firmicutes bacterium]|nr:NYN domain-containing protein [Bacillota bacterium]
MNYLIVDGYNVIGSWPELKALQKTALAEARDRLVEMLLEYRAYTGEHVVVVFDAYRSKGAGSQESWPGLDVYYTEYGQTADSLIEKLTAGLTDRNQVAVVTSDWAQQQIVMGKGARRWSSREFYLEYKRVSAVISQSARNTQTDQQTTRLETRLKNEALKDLKRFTIKGSSPGKP